MIKNLICENGQDKDMDTRSDYRSFRFTRVSNVRGKQNDRKEYFYAACLFLV